MTTLRCMRLQAPHCPSCGAPIEVPVGAQRATCGYCGSHLVVEAERVSTQRPRPPRTSDGDEAAPYPEPDATLWTRESPRFELSVIEQHIPEAVPELFTGVELSGERFAFVSLRAVDREGRPLEHPLQVAFTALRTSLESDGDPGLAANLALEALCDGGFEHRLECGVVLFEPRHMRVVPYTAGLRDGLLWASGEAGRCVTIGGHHEALERRMLRETADHFSNAAVVHLASGDLVLVPSAGFTGRGAQGYSNGLRALLEVGNARLGEAPLRVVTLAKNAFWAAFQQQRHSVSAPVGDVRLAAVRAIPPTLATALPAGVERRLFRTRRFEVALLASPGDALALYPLRGERHALVWLSSGRDGVSDAQLEVAAEAVLAVLDGDTGDNENPRSAGRQALGALGVAPETLRLAVIQLFDVHQRVKYFRHGWKQPVALGPRGFRGDSMQQFDEGGEATVGEGARLFFPGALEYEDQHGQAAELASVWPGGKASRLYEAMGAHWKTKRSEPALERLALAAVSDQPDATVSGLALVTGVPALFPAK